MLNLMLIVVLTLVAQIPSVEGTASATSLVVSTTQVQQWEAENQSLRTTNEKLSALLTIYIQLEQLELILEQYPEFIKWKKLMIIKTRMEAQMRRRSTPERGSKGAEERVKSEG